MARCRLSPDGVCTHRGKLSHGMTGYTVHGCRCERCRRIMSAYRARRKAEGKDQRGPREVFRCRVEPCRCENLQHGTESAYTNHRCRCRPCREAMREAQQRRVDERRRRIREGEAEVEHGTPRGYLYWRCRCQDCRRAAARLRVERRAARSREP